MLSFWGITLCPLAFIPGAPGGWELIIVALIMLLLFGNRLPSVMRSMGKSVTEFKKGINEIDDAVQDKDKDKDEESK